MKSSQKLFKTFKFFSNEICLKKNTKIIALRRNIS